MCTEFSVVVALDRGSPKCQNGVCDLDLENEVKVQRSRNLDWPYLSSQNQNVCSSGHALPTSSTWVNSKREFELLTLKFGKNVDIT